MSAMEQSARPAESWKTVRIAPPGSGQPQPAGSFTPMGRLTELELFERLGWFVSIRWIAGTAALLLVLIAWYVFGIRIPPQPVVLTICVLFLYNAVFLMLVTDAYRRHRVNRLFITGCANAQMLCDSLTLAVLMHFTGGVENPFLIFAICPLIVVSQLLPARNAYAHAALAALLIHLVAWLEYAGTLSHVPVGEAIGVEIYHNLLAVAKFTGALSLLVFSTVWLASSITTRLRRRERELETAYDQLQEIERSKSFLMRQTSHDLRAPLNALVSVLRALAVEVRGKCEPKVAESLSRAEQRALGLTMLIDELHRYATLRDATAVLSKQHVNLSQEVKESIYLYTLMAEERGLRLVSNIAESVYLEGNTDMLIELISNLLVNAIQYTPAGGQIQVHLATTNQAVCLEVRDTGIGIPADVLSRIFDEFYRAPNAKKAFHSGTGMGLPIVKRIVQAHNGTIEVRSQVGQGTWFTVILPA